MSQRSAAVSTTAPQAEGGEEHGQGKRVFGMVSAVFAEMSYVYGGV
jgi:hypothetical protein